MLSNAIQCYPMLSNAIQCYPMLSNAIQCYPMLKSRFWGSGRAKSHKYKIYVPFSNVFFTRNPPRAFGNFLCDCWHSRHISPFVNARESSIHALNPARSAGENFRFWGSGSAKSLTKIALPGRRPNPFSAAFCSIQAAHLTWACSPCDKLSIL
jgi:hypothetical protein